MPTSAEQFSAALDRLRTEGRMLENLVQDLPAEDWAKPTPAAGWTIAHQIAHLTWTDGAALAALHGEAAFEPYKQRSQENRLEFVDEVATQGAQQDPVDLYTQWQTSRAQLATALEQSDKTVRYPWFGPGMKARSMITARIMETWAHGQDVANALGAQWPATDALQDIAHLGLATRQFTYQNNDLEAPTSELYVELTGPNDQLWMWGNPTAENSVTGSAWDFALLVTQRAELEDLNLQITGDDAKTWASIAQAFAGPPKAAVRARQAR